MFKKINLIGIAILSAFAVMSCTYEPLEGEFLSSNPNNPTNPSDPNNPGNPEGSVGVYFPLAVGNEWVFNDTESANSQFQFQEAPIEVVGSFTQEGVLYYEMPPMTSADPMEGMEFPGGMEMDFNVDVTSGVSYQNGDYTQVSEIITSASAMGMSITQTSTLAPHIMLKEDLAAGESWTTNVEMTVTTEMSGSSMPPQTMTVPYTFNVIEKDVTATVAGTTYNDVIKITSNSSGSFSEFWFAKDIGPIRLYYEDGTGGSLLRELSSYTLN